MIVARINGKEITSRQLDCESIFMNLRCKDISAQETTRKALKSLINTELVTQAAEKLGIIVEEYEVDEGFVDVITHFCTEEKYKAKLEEYHLTETELRNRLEKHILVGKYLHNRFDCDDDDCEEKLLKFFESNSDLFITEDRARVSHILISNNLPDAIETARNIRKKIKTEKDFEELAQNNSCCPSVLKNGDLGYVIPGQLMPELDEAIFKLNKGEVSDIIETIFGYHIFYIKEYEPARRLDFLEVKHLLKRYRQKMFFELNVEKHYAELRQQADIDIK
ncbi:MAG: peptidylprolyl isomerase [Candidatus Cloacimonetes bacterium]|nr:peptidylprolyl isomerase [Candidatus Cloacimonadota bacterium]